MCRCVDVLRGVDRSSGLSGWRQVVGFRPPAGWWSPWRSTLGIRQIWDPYFFDTAILSPHGILHDLTTASDGTPFCFDETSDLVEKKGTLFFDETSDMTTVLMGPCVLWTSMCVCCCEAPNPGTALANLGCKVFGGFGLPRKRFCTGFRQNARKRVPELR